MTKAPIGHGQEATRAAAGIIDCVSQFRLKRTGARGPARGRRRKQAKEELAEIQRLLAAFESGLVLRDQNRRPQARERRRSSLERLDAARAAMAQRKDVQPEWVMARIMVTQCSKTIKVAYQ
jgi:hypothetical protein